jgi:preprotein translocase subunit SecE
MDLPATDLPITDPPATDPLATDPLATDQPAPDPNSSRSAVGTQPIEAASDLQLAAPGSRIETEPQGFAAASLAELRKVVWPSRQQLFSESVAVILMVGLSAAAIAAVDRFYGWASTQVFR